MFFVHIKIIIIFLIYTHQNIIHFIYCIWNYKCCFSYSNSIWSRLHLGIHIGRRIWGEPILHYLCIKDKITNYTKNFSIQNFNEVHSSYYYRVYKSIRCSFHQHLVYSQISCQNESGNARNKRTRFRNNVCAYNILL